MIELHRISSNLVDWNPSPVVSLATSVDGLQVAAAREDGSLEIWLVSPGSVGWHRQLTIHGDPNKRVSSLIWCRGVSRGMPLGRLFSSNIDGSVCKWDLSHLKQKPVLGSIGVSIWQMALAPSITDLVNTEAELHHMGNGYLSYNNDNDHDEHETSDSEEESDSSNSLRTLEYPRVAIGCDDGSVRMYAISDTDEFMCTKSLPRVSGRVLSVTWSTDANFIYSGSSDGLIRCWDATLGREIYRITAGLGGLGGGPELCIWSLLSLRSGTLVSADSSGSVQFWDSQQGTLLQAHSLHKGDVNALAAAPTHNRVFSAGSDGKIILYKLSSESVSSNSVESPAVMKRWIYVDYVRAHTHDVRALTVAVPICREDPLPDETKRPRRLEKPIDFSYRKWAHLGVPMLISAGVLFAYSDHVKPSLFELKSPKVGESAWSVMKRQLPGRLPFAHSMIFTHDSSRLIVAGHDQRIYIVDVSSSGLVHVFTPSREMQDEGLPPTEPPITRMFASSDGQWLAAVNCFGDVYVFNLEILRQHWFISRLDGASVTAGGFPPENNNVLIVTTSSNQVYALDVEAKQLGEWSMRHAFVLPKRFQEFPGEVIGLSFPPSSTSSSVVVYSARAMCLIDFGLPVEQDDGDLSNVQDSMVRNLQNHRKRKHRPKRNFEILEFRDPVLHISHLSKSSILLIDKPWLEVVKSLEAQPVHRHIFGT
ncbi:hypothetical protein QN277_015401 [Acacia crassicarpa]|uniref:Uncharacterized protein n=1 Tax=Acacia crassicarpa TaxID=499986 RepID=A0AAE1JYC0_9FABA|nr:hypothetical protein QN277_015401 [Acacia crassicarpa]